MFTDMLLAVEVEVVGTRTKEDQVPKRSVEVEVDQAVPRSERALARR